MNPNLQSNLLILVHSKFKSRIQLDVRTTNNCCNGPRSRGPAELTIFLVQILDWLDSQTKHMTNDKPVCYKFGPFWDFSATSLFSRKTYPTSLSSITLMKESTSSSSRNINKPQYLQLLNTIFLFFLKYGN